MHSPLHANRRLKDEIARELFEDIEHSNETSAGENRADGDQSVDVAVGLEGTDPDSGFLNDERQVDIDILTGGAGE
jgi:hypothetical protein